jgi:hypothetical protein
MPAQRVDQLGALLDHKLAHFQQAGLRLLLRLLDRDKAHRRPRRRLADRLGVNAVVFAAFDKRLDVLRRDQLDPVPQRLQPAAPMVRGAARFQQREVLFENAIIGGEPRMATSVGAYYCLCSNAVFLAD